LIRPILIEYRGIICSLSKWAGENATVVKADFDLLT